MTHAKKTTMGRTIRRTIPALLQTIAVSLSEDIGCGFQKPGWVLVFASPDLGLIQKRQSLPNRPEQNSHEGMLEIIHTNSPASKDTRLAKVPLWKSWFNRLRLCCTSGDSDDGEGRLRKLIDDAELCEMFQLHADRERLSQEQMERLLLLIDRSCAALRAMSYSGVEMRSIEIGLRLDGVRVIENIIVLFRRGVVVAFPLRSIGATASGEEPKLRNGLTAVAASVYKEVEAIAEFSEFLIDQNIRRRRNRNEGYGKRQK